LKKNLTKNINMRILVIRTSAMGDVALTTPVLTVLRKQYPGVELVLLTRPVFKAFFTSINGLKLFLPDLKKRHKGFIGIVKLFQDIREIGEFDYVIDLHDVLRSKILRMLFRIHGVPVSVINKGRSEKRSVIKGNAKARLSHSVERYCDTFNRAGFPVVLSQGPWIIPSSESLSKVISLSDFKSELNIGVAPYAKHKLKMWPEDNMLKLLSLISGKHKVRYWLFGGMDESEKLSHFQAKLSGPVALTGNLNLEEELALMSKLDFMIAMDSSNMHMAALTGIKVISIWGGTDPISGFGAWMQPENYCISISSDELKCRPCTTFGKGNCRRGDFACMNWLTPELVFRKMDKLKIW
jgi:ADP-heptose:LPS heptosyltransferase